MTAGSFGFVDVEIDMEGFNGESTMGCLVRIGWFLRTFSMVYLLSPVTEWYLPALRI